jgi:hypothetical protein
MSQALGVSQSTLSRLLRPLERSGRIVRLGVTRGARYGLARAVASVGHCWPLYRIDEAGSPEEIATVHAIERDRYFVLGGPPRVQGSFEGLPYYLQDARPAGFLGRAIPAAHLDLALPQRVVDWTDSHVLVYLSQRGSESVGNLIIGAEALDRYLRDERGPCIVSAEARPTIYPTLANQAMFGAPPGSSAHGEHPKFSVRVATANSLTHVLVKFSPPRSAPTGVRWADLLISEHLAALVLAEHGIPSARSELLEYDDQVFLQSERFDRVSHEGRRGVVSLYSIDTARYGMLDSWLAAAARLRADGLLSAEDTERLALLDTFGGLIANSDRHFGNVTFFDDHAGAFRLAPVYDMLPMLFAPQDGQVVERTFVPPAPTAATLGVWPHARELAEAYWQRLAADGRLSHDFRARSTRALEAVRALSMRGASRAHDV